MSKTRRIEAVCTQYDVPLKAAALQFPLAHPAVQSLVVGIIAPTEVDQNLAALREGGLIEVAAPVPNARG